MVSFLRKCFDAVPAPLAHHLYFRLIRRLPALHRHPDLYTSAALRLAPDFQMRLNRTDGAHGQLAWLGVYENPLSRAIVDLARDPGGRLVDVGANYGYFTLLWCAAKPGNTAIAIEASPRNLGALRENIQRNGIGERVVVCDWAASNATGSVSFDLGPVDQTGWGGISTSPASDNSTVTIPCYRLDEQVSSGPVTVVKIDCEGADSLVIAGCEGLLRSRSIAHLFYEENPTRMRMLELRSGTAKRQLEALGYRVECLVDGVDTEFHAQPDRVQTSLELSGTV